MSLALLLEKYDVSTEEGLQKALSEIEKEEVAYFPCYLILFDCQLSSSNLLFWL